MIDPVTGEFSFEGLRRDHYVEPELGNTERHMLRQMAEPGQPLWKMQKGLLDYQAALERQFVNVDLTSPAGVVNASRLQTEIKAVIWQREMWERALAHVPEPEEEEGKPS